MWKYICLVVTLASRSSAQYPSTTYGIPSPVPVPAPATLQGFQQTFRIIPNGQPGTVQFPFFGNKEAAGLTSVSSFSTSGFQNDASLQQRPVFQNDATFQQRPVFQNAPAPSFSTTPSFGGLELLPPKQHVVGTKYPAVDPGPGFRFPVSQLVNTRPPSNLL